MGARIYDYDDLLNQLFDALSDAPEGWTIHEISSYLDVPEHVAANTIRALRMACGDSDDINVSYRVDGRQRRYVLIGNLDAAKERLHIRLSTYLANFETERAILQSIVTAYKGKRNREAQKARTLLKYFTRLDEDIRELEATADISPEVDSATTEAQAS